MKLFLALLSIAILSVVGCNSRPSSAFVVSSQNPLCVIADVHATTNELIRALRALQASKGIREPPEFWSAIANDTNYGVAHRQRAVLQLFARHFKPGMTIHQIALLLNHPTWLVQEGCNFYSMGSPPPGGDDDNWACVSIFFHDPQPAMIWFGFRKEVSARAGDLFQCLEGNPVNAEIDNIKVMGIVSDEILPHYRRVRNRFGIPGDSSASAGR
jgi:hypothetical protein